MYDLIIIGSGPAGLTAGIYASRAKLKTLIIESEAQVGGQVSTTSEVENWPGQFTTGPALMQSFKDHCVKFGNEFVFSSVKSIDIPSDSLVRKVHLSNGKVYETKTIIIATGSKPRVLGIPGEIEFRGKGVSYCATCDGEFYTDLEIIALGSGNTALEESVFLTRFVKKVTLIVIHPEGKVDGSAYAFEEAKQNPKIDFIWNSSISQIYGSKLVEGVKLINMNTKEITDIKTDGVFMFVGSTPINDIIKDIVKLNKDGYIQVNEKMETSVPGIFAAGDIIEKYLRQIVTASADGAIAAVAAQQYISLNEKEF
jgi:thioredoxin reductase (NADPH)